jgi:superfamily II DNA helicase RecQ
MKRLLAAAAAIATSARRKRASKPSGTLSAGKLFTEAGGGQARRDFERILGGLARAGFVRLEDASFEKDGKTIAFRKVHLTPDGHRLGEEDPGFQIAGLAGDDVHPSRQDRRKKSGKDKGAKKASPAAHPDLEKKLKAWRLAEAKKQNLPAFRILTDAVVRALATERPESREQLLAVHGIGPRGVEKYGAAILKALHT